MEEVLSLIHRNAFVANSHFGGGKRPTIMAQIRRRGICHAHIKRDFAKIEAQGGIFALLGGALLFQHARMFALWHRHKSGEISLEELPAIPIMRNRTRVRGIYGGCWVSDSGHASQSTLDQTDVAYKPA